MFSFNKTKVIDFYTDKPEVYEFCKPYKATSNPPDWFKNNKVNKTNPFKDELKTIRGCPAITYNLKESIILPMWADLAVMLNRNEEGVEFNWKFSSKNFSGDYHDIKQRYGLFSNKINLKLHSPWIIKSNLKLMFTEPMYYDSYPDGVSTVTGINDFKYYTETNIHLLFDIPIEKEVLYHIDAFSPITSMTPLTEHDFKINTHLVSSDELNKIKNSKYYPAFFDMPFYKLKKHKDNQDNKSKCPFHFWK